ncbi:MAG TPA: PaaI family thioesterase [Anaerolineales bacterium]|nr:PaaI family thioesterase [Anaerolineales bacterium]
MTEKAFQDFYPDNLSHCYGCGRLNENGLHVRSFWDGDETVCSFSPRPYHTAIPGFVYGGLLASLIDCHSTGSASAAAYRAENRPMGSEPPIRFVTASLKVDYLRPTPIEGPLLLRSRFDEIGRRKVIVRTDLFVGDLLCVQGQVVTVRLRDEGSPATDLGSHDRTA